VFLVRLRRAHWHRFQVLTSRADRLAELSAGICWPENVWMGVSVEIADGFASAADACGPDRSH